MTWTFVAPLLLATVATYLVTLPQRVLPPRVAAWMLALVAVATAVASTWLILAMSLAWVGQQESLDRWLGWCDDLVSAHDRVPLIIGAASVVALAAVAATALTTWRRYRRAWQTDAIDPIEILDDPQPLAHAIPRRRGHSGTVVLSVGLIDALEPDEVHAVVAHEQAHLRHRHHRFLIVMDIAAGVMPLLRPLRRQLRLATERWADEDAAVAVGSRSLVASAVARAALATTDQPYALAISGGSVVVRVDALIHPRVTTPLTSASTAVAALMAVAGIVATATQVHHTLRFFAHLCT